MNIYTKKKLIEKFKEIEKLGWIENNRFGNHGGVGNTSPANNICLRSLRGLVSSEPFKAIKLNNEGTVYQVVILLSHNHCVSLLGDKVSSVTISDRLTTSPVCLVSKGEGFSLNMEQVLSEANMGGMPVPKAQKVMELNPEHKIFSILNTLYDKGEEGEPLLSTYAELLYGQSLLIEGLPLDDPTEIAHKMVDIMVSADAK